MSRWISLLLMFGVFAEGGVALGAKARAEVVAGVMEALPQADVLKLVVSPKVGVQMKKVCSPDAIRIRLYDVGVAGNRIKNYPVPAGSDFSRVRIIPKTPQMSVIQLFAKRGVMGLCSRTTAVLIEDTLVVSTSLTPDQRRIRGSNSGERDQSPVASSAKKVTADSDQSPVASLAKKVTADPTPVKKATTAKDKTTSAATQEGFQMDTRGTIFDHSTAQKENKALAKGSDQTMKYAGVLLFAAVIGFIAYYLKKNRSRFQISEDHIELLSSRKLTSHQQLVVARVNGAKFLLAVGDKSVSALGAVPDGGVVADIGTGVVSGLSPDHVNDVNRSCQSNTGRASKVQQAIARSAYPTGPVAEPINRHDEERVAAQGSYSIGDKGFEQALAQAVDRITAQQEPTGRGMTPEPNRNLRDSSQPISSNVEGLINMARMRASLDHHHKVSKGA